MDKKKDGRGGAREGAGRPRGPARDRRSRVVSVRVTRTEYAALVVAAKTAGKLPPEYMRWKIMG